LQAAAALSWQNSNKHLMDLANRTDPGVRGALNRRLNRQSGPSDD